METGIDQAFYFDSESGAAASLQTNTSPASTTRNGYDLDVYLNVPSRQRALIVDDDSDTVRLLKLALQKAGLDVMGALDGFEAVRKCTDTHPDIVLLDLMMPDMDGWETLRMLRQIRDIPVVIVSAKDGKEDIVKGLNAGGDDYVAKPFHLDEVVARVQAVLRRSKQDDVVNRRVFPEVGLTVDYETREVIMNDATIQFTPKTFAVLKVLTQNAPRPVSHKQIAEEVWGEDTPQVRKRIKYTILLIRRKLGDQNDKPNLILNRPAFGYQLNTQPHSAYES
ncbi:MAG: response regulator transcription factor [Anaerolineales bacterium]|jgi:DNA-binding response OmpR family regulator